MSITLITGGPGLGKSALAVKMLITEYKGRPIFSNIRGLVLSHSPLPNIDQWTIENHNDQGTLDYSFTFPPGAIVVIDECQDFFRPRTTGSKVPPYVTAFETHRHKGIDFILITQGSRLIDSNIRALVKGGRHIFLRSSYLGRYRHERTDVIDEESKTDRQLATTSKYRLPTDVYHLYKSSELHTKPPKAKLPKQVYIIGIIIVILAYTGFHMKQRFYTLTHKNEVIEEQAGRHSPPASGATLVSVVPLKIQDSLKPTDKENILSAPIYAHVIPTVVPPQINGCIASVKKCRCYTQQITVVDIPKAQCLKRVNGEYYDPYRPNPIAEQKNVSTPPRSQLDQVPRSPVGESRPAIGSDQAYRSSQVGSNGVPGSQPVYGRQTQNVGL